MKIWASQFGMSWHYFT